MSGAIILTLIAVAVLGVLAKIGWDALEILREDRRRYGRVTSYAVFRVGVIVVLVLLFLGYLALGWVLGGEDPAARP